MAKLKLQSNASGTGVVTLTAPNTNTDRTVTLPDSTGTLLMTDGDGSNLTGLSSPKPAFLAHKYNDSQFIGNGSSTKVTLGTETLDTDGWYDNSTNYRYTPQTAGWYSFFGKIRINSSSNMNELAIMFYKNGTSHSQNAFNNPGYLSDGVYPAPTTLIYCNGSTDYVEMYALRFQGGTVNIGDHSDIASACEFGATLIREA